MRDIGSVGMDNEFYSPDSSLMTCPAAVSALSVSSLSVKRLMG
jgi:hypothetical protein